MAVIYRAITKDGSARALVCDTRDIVSRACEIHRLTPTTSAALGRTLTAASLMGSLMGEKEDLLTLRFKGDGAGGTIVATSDYAGNVRGFIENPAADLPLRPDGKLDVGRCVGKGSLYVIRDTGGSEPYIGATGIRTGEIGEDIAGYYADSEQIPTMCALGVLVDRDYSIKCAGGALIQMLPFADGEIAERIEKNSQGAAGITTLLQQMTPEQIFNVYLDGIEFDIFDRIECAYKCDCSRKKTDRALISLGKKELDDIIASEQEETVMTCGFCDAVYKYSKSDLKALREKIK